MKIEHEHRVAILEMHGSGTPPSAIPRNIVSIVKATAPWLDPVPPTVDEVKRIGFELPTVVEVLSARKVAACYKARLLGFDESSDKQEPMITTHMQACVLGSNIHTRCPHLLPDCQLPSSVKPVSPTDPGD